MGRTVPLVRHARCLQMEMMMSSFMHHQPPEISHLDRELAIGPGDTFLLSVAGVTSISTTRARCINAALSRRVLAGMVPGREDRFL
jgi:hypothetical protein